MKQPMKKILLLNRDQSNSNGQEIIFQHLVNGLTGSGFSTTVATTYGNDSFSILDSDIPTIELHPQATIGDDKWFSKKERNKIYSAIAQNEYLLLNHPLHNMLSMFSLRVAYKMKKPIISVFHGKAASRSRYKQLLLSIRRKIFMTYTAYKSAKLVFLTEEDSSFFLNDVLFRKGQAQKKKIVIHNGIDVTDFSPQQQTTNDTNSILFVGSLTQTKGVLDLLTVADSFKKDFPAAHFYFAGKGTLEGEIRNRENCTLLGVLDREQLQSTYNKAAIFTLPSYSECFPMVLLEALSMAKPIVTSDIYGIRSILANTHSWFVTPGDTKALYDSIATALQMPEKERLLVGQNNREHAIAMYSMQSMIESYSQLINSL